MKIDISSSLVLGTTFFYFFFFFFSLVFCVSDVRAEVTVQPYSHKLGRTYLSPVDSVRSTTSKPKVFRRGEKWTAEEEERLIRLRAQSLSWQELADVHFPWRTGDALRTKYSMLTRDPSKPPRKTRRWTKEEKDLLVELVEMGESYEEIAKRFPGCSPNTLQAQYRSLTQGRHVPTTVFKKYTAEEDERVLELRREGLRWREIVLLFDDRSIDSLRRRYKVLIASDFTSEEDELLQELEEENIPWTERVTFFNNRSLDALQERLEDLKRSNPRFTPEEDDTIVEALELGMSVSEVVQLLKRAQTSVYARIRKLKTLGRLDASVASRRRRRYSTDELELISELAETGMSWKDIASEHFPGRGGMNVKKAYDRYQVKKQKEKEQEG